MHAEVRPGDAALSQLNDYDRVRVIVLVRNPVSSCHAQMCSVRFRWKPTVVTVSMLQFADLLATFSTAMACIHGTYN
ncbi:C4-dicarboxylate ABC transporter [Anopheles sinensis]|uniref:C4-dicarboxylate ABC transporter n=1 Tax=Anopheles sinensis TaxID=74873 RepID=A0A084WJX0_ANOSI|nr:C4-dicarboxylate ABC transporter [Anopheles sinensis]